MVTSDCVRKLLVHLQSKLAELRRSRVTATDDEWRRLELEGVEAIIRSQRLTVELQSRILAELRRGGLSEELRQEALELKLANDALRMLVVEIQQSRRPRRSTDSRAPNGPNTGTNDRTTRPSHVSEVTQRYVACSTKSMSSTPKKTKEAETAAGERKRDEQRDEAGPAYGGEAWKVADQRGDQRFGKARNDDADPSTMVKKDPDIKDADPEVESGAEHAGFGRGEKPRTPA